MHPVQIPFTPEEDEASGKAVSGYTGDGWARAHHESEKISAADLNIGRILARVWSRSGWSPA